MLRTVAPAVLLAVTVLLAGCGPSTQDRTLVLGGIPDQDFALLEERFGGVADALSEHLGIPVRYAPSTDYATLVTAFEHGDVQLAWFGGLTGVQARRAVPGAHAVVHRPRDAEFRSAFIVGADSDARTLRDLAGGSFTFGSESSTSGHLMPRHFLVAAGVEPERDFTAVNHSGSHDATWQLVEAGVWDAGVLNVAVWERAVREGRVDPARVRVLEVTEPYLDYHWVVHPELDRRFGDGTTGRVVDGLLSLHERPGGPELLGLFETDRFVRTEDANYGAIEEVAASLGLLGEG